MEVSVAEITEAERYEVGFDLYERPAQALIELRDPTKRHREVETM